MTQHRKQVFKPAGEEGTVHIDPPLKAAEEIIAVDPPGSKDDEPKIIVAEPVNGWKEITPDQQTGKHYIVTHDPNKDGVQAYWRKTRVMLHFRWVLNGKWTDAMTNQYLIPQPLFYQEI